ncbi:hypothetical protein COT30_05365, partial [Candidatus Micrarchaeota archaeon CG08_land_8_20_14_0_20_49_17]
MDTTQSDAEKVETAKLAFSDLTFQLGRFEKYKNHSGEYPIGQCERALDSMGNCLQTLSELLPDSLESVARVLEAGGVAVHYRFFKPNGNDSSTRVVRDLNFLELLAANHPAACKSEAITGVARRKLARLIEKQKINDLEFINACDWLMFIAAARIPVGRELITLLVGFQSLNLSILFNAVMAVEALGCCEAIPVLEQMQEAGTLSGITIYQAGSSQVPPVKGAELLRQAIASLRSATLPEHPLVGLMNQARQAPKPALSGRNAPTRVGMSS